jgi:hypothetical protein
VKYTGNNEREKTMKKKNNASTGRRSALLLAVGMLCAGFHGVLQAALPRLAPEQIVQKSVDARGGLEAWRKVHAMSMSGLMDAGKTRTEKPQETVPDPRRKKALKVRDARLFPQVRTETGEVVQLPFVMELKRPRSVRLELKFNGATAIQSYDGSTGWKLRPWLGKAEVEPFNAEETKQALQQQELDGLLVDYAAKGSHVELEGVEAVDGRDAYKLKVTLKSGEVRHVWIDGASFLEVQVDGSRRMDGKPKTMLTALQDYRRVDGVMVPHRLSTRIAGSADAQTIVISHVEINPVLPDAHFARP